MDWATILGAAKTAGAAYQGYKNPGAAQKQGQDGPLMKYLRQRRSRKYAPTRDDLNRMPNHPGGPQLPPGWSGSPYEEDVEDPFYGGTVFSNRYAEGGVVTKPTTALIGENGPEMVVPLTNRPDAKVGPQNAMTGGMPGAAPGLNPMAPQPPGMPGAMPQSGGSPPAQLTPPGQSLTPPGQRMGQGAVPPGQRMGQMPGAPGAMPGAMPGQQPGAMPGGMGPRRPMPQMNYRR